MTEAERYERAVELFERCLAAPPSERAAVLDSGCAGDEALRREVQGMLSYDPSEDRTLDTPARRLLDSALDAARADGAPEVQSRSGRTG